MVFDISVVVLLLDGFFQTGNYLKKNINMPKKVPLRAGGPPCFNKDSPITEVGQFQARLTGKSTNSNSTLVIPWLPRPRLCRITGCGPWLPAANGCMAFFF